MKKFITVLWIAVMLCLALTCACAAVREDADSGAWIVQQYEMLRREERVFPLNTGEDQGILAFRLPEALEIIEDEAFEGTAIVSVDLPERVERIGSNAFAHIPTLQHIRIPDATREIAATAFAGSHHVTITGAPNSYARAWAREHDTPFAPAEVVYAGTGAPQLSATAAQTREEIKADCSGTAEGVQKHPQWRPASEIKAELYDACIANHFSGRAPPACA